MQRIRWLGGLTLIAGVGSGTVATAHRSPAPPPEAVVGTWKLDSAKANGRLIDVPRGTTILKHVTPTDFVFVYYNAQGLITVAGGGRYTLKGNRYEESVEYGYGEGMAPLIGKTQVFTLRIEDGRWYHSGTESDGTVVAEVWERARPVGAR